MSRTKTGSKRPDVKLCALLAVVMTVVLASSGCIAPSIFGRPDPPSPLPTVFQEDQPSIDQIIHAVNANSSRIQSFWSDDVKISGDMVPIGRLSGSVDFERPRQLRIRVGSMLAPTELDLGSNQDRFWFWARLNPSKDVLYAQHNQFLASPIRRYFPFEPEWLIEAMGLTEFRMDQRHQGPFIMESGHLTIRTTCQTPVGPMTKDTTIDPITAVVVAQSLYDSQGRLLGTVLAEDHRNDPVSNLTMPRRITLLTYPPQEGVEPGTPVKTIIYLGNVQINRPRFSAENAVYAMPTYDGYRPVDLCGPDSPMAAMLGPPQGSVPSIPTGYQAPPQYPAPNPPQSAPPQGRPGVPATNPYGGTRPAHPSPSGMSPAASPVSTYRTAPSPSHGLPGEYRGFEGTH